MHVNLNLYKKITFLLLIKERREFTLRLIKYLSITKFPFKIFIADGSKSRIKQEYLNILKTNNVNFQYKKFKHDSTYKIFNEKILNSLKLIQTDYVQLFSDDDFPIVENQLKFVKFLEKNKSYNSCGGYATNFQLLKNVFIKQETYGQLKGFNKILNNKCNDYNSKKKRIEYFLNHPQTSWHNIYRTKILLKNYTTVKKQNAYFFNIHFYDNLQDMANYISGKTKKINFLQFIHQHHESSFINSRLTIEEAKKNKTFDLDLKKLIYIILKTFFKKNKEISFMIRNSDYFNQKDTNLEIRVVGTDKFKTANIYKILKIIIYLLYNIFLNVRLYISNKHILKLILAEKNFKVKKELTFIFRFLNKIF